MENIVCRKNAASPMSLQTNNDFRCVKRFAFVGLLLLAFTALSPLTFDARGHFFFSVAAHSNWDDFGDWVPAWCSLKMIILALGGVLLGFAIAELFIALGRTRGAYLCAFLMAPPILLFFVGCYNLIKAVF